MFNLKTVDMKVYVFVANGAADGDVSSPIINVFASKEKACEKLKSWVEGEEGEREYANKRGWDVYLDTPDYFGACDEGDYANNHTEIEVLECEVE